MTTDRDKLERLLERVRGALDKINFDPRPPFQISESGTVEPVDHDTADAIRFILGASRSLLALVLAAREMRRGWLHVEDCSCPLCEPRDAYDAALQEIREP